MTLSVCVAGATGWTGRPVAEAVLAAEDLQLCSVVSRSAAGGDLGQAWGGEPNGVPVFGRVGDALDGVDVLVDYTSHDAVRDNTLTAIEHGVAVVVGASGLSAQDFGDIDAVARDAAVGVVAAGNFSLTAALAQAAALLAARHLPSWEIIDYASAAKPDAPSGTARELAERLAEVAAPRVEVSVDQTAGHVEARGATIAGHRSTRYGCPASSRRPRSCSLCRTNASSSATTRAPPRRRTWPAPCLLYDTSPAAPDSSAAWTPCSSTATAEKIGFLSRNRSLFEVVSLTTFSSPTVTDRL